MDELKKELDLLKAQFGCACKSLPSSCQFQPNFKVRRDIARVRTLILNEKAVQQMSETQH